MTSVSAIMKKVLKKKLDRVAAEAKVQKLYTEASKLGDAAYSERDSVKRAEIHAAQKVVMKARKAAEKRVMDLSKEIESLDDQEWRRRRDHVTDVTLFGHVIR